MGRRCRSGFRVVAWQVVFCGCIVVKAFVIECFLGMHISTSFFFSCRDLVNLELFSFSTAFDRSFPSTSSRLRLSSTSLFYSYLGQNTELADSLAKSAHLGATIVSCWRVDFRWSAVCDIHIIFSLRCAWEVPC